MNPRICIISHLRPENVKRIQAVTGDAVCWYVGKGEAESYHEQGAHFVMESGGLCESRNVALEDAFKDNAPCVQISDDLKKLEWTKDGTNKMELSFSMAVQMMQVNLEKSQFKLAGVAPTPNTFYFHLPYSTKNFIVGDFIMVLPSAPRFDEKLKLKEDYDFTVQHLKRYAGALRCNRILATFQHKSNKGGAVAIRTGEKEQEAIKYLMEKHPGFFKMNPRRQNEILLARLK